MKFAKITEEPISATNQLNSKVLEWKREGKDIIDFSAGDIFLKPHQNVIKGIESTLGLNTLSYPPCAGIPELRESASDFLAKCYGLSDEPREILVTPSGKMAIYLALKALVDPGEQVIIPKPYWVSFPSIVKHVGAKPIFLETSSEMHWKITPKLLESLNAHSTKVLILNNPNNPSGGVYSEEELIEIMHWAKKNGIWVLADEVYSNLIFDEEFVSMGSISKEYKRIIIIQSMSKNFALAGIRVGFAKASKELIDAMVKLMTQTVTSTSVLSQYAALAALRGYSEVLEYVKKDVLTKREVFLNTMKKQFGIQMNCPAALYGWVRVNQLTNEPLNCIEYCERSLQKGVAITPGKVFGIPNYVRFSFGIDQESIEKGLSKLQDN